MAPDGKRAYFTAGQTGYVVEVDTATNKVIRGIPTHGKISHMVLVSPDGQRIYTANITSQNVSVIDRQTGNTLWSTAIPGKAHGLSIINHQLYISTDQGKILSFTSTPPQKLP